MPFLWLMMRQAALRQQAMVMLMLAAADMARSASGAPAEPVPAENVVSLADYRRRRAAR